MADLTITASDVAIVESVEQDTAPTAAALDAGSYVKPNSATGKWEAGDASAAGNHGNLPGIMVISSKYAGQAVTVIRKGLLYLGDALDGLDFDDPVYLSDTAGALADAAGTTEKIVGYVAPIFGETTPKKGLRVDL